MELAIKSASILQHSNAEDRTAASQLQLSEFDSNNIICISFFFIWSVFLAHLKDMLIWLQLVSVGGGGGWRIGVELMGM